MCTKSSINIEGSIAVDAKHKVDLSQRDTNQYSSSALSFIGDAVYSLFVRESLARRYDKKAGGLHKLASTIVSAVSQAEFVETVVKDKFTSQELAIFNRCKNSHISNKPNNCTYEQYKKATGFEGVLGYLYLNKSIDRIMQIVEWRMEQSSLL